MAYPRYTGPWRAPLSTAPSSVRTAGRALHDLTTPVPDEAPPPLEYPAHFLVKRVTDAGTIRFQSRLLFLANALDNYRIGMEAVDNGI